ncbi:MAG: hypothetical protein ABIK68_17000, partial [bacterium]
RFCCYSVKDRHNPSEKPATAYESSPRYQKYWRPGVGNLNATDSGNNIYFYFLLHSMCSSKEFTIDSTLLLKMTKPMVPVRVFPSSELSSPDHGHGSGLPGFGDRL